MQIVFGRSKKGNFAIKYEDDAEWRICESPKGTYECFDTQDASLGGSEYQRLEHLRAQLLKEKT